MTSKIYIDLLFKQYGKTVLNRKELSEVLGISLSSLEKLLLQEQLPIRHQRVGCSQKARYVFPVVEVANFLAFVEAA